MNWKPILLSVVLVFILGVISYVYRHDVDIVVLNPQGPVAAYERWILVVTALLSSIVVIPVFVMLFFFAWKYRASNPRTGEHHLPDWDHDNNAAEVVWWLVPTAIIAVLSFIAWQSSHELDPYKPLVGNGKPLTIQVIALDWKWLFIYPEEGIASVNMVEFPERTPITFEITADAPMNSFWIPSLGGQIMAMSGMSTKLNLMADRTGVFNGSSANISGAGFAGMTFAAKSVSESDFEDWVQAVRNSSSSPLSASTYTALATPSTYMPVTYYAPVDRDLYTKIIMKFMLPMNTSSTQTQ